MDIRVYWKRAVGIAGTTLSFHELEVRVRYRSMPDIADLTGSLPSRPLFLTDQLNRRAFIAANLAEGNGRFHHT